MFKRIIILIVISLASFVNGQTFDDFINDLNATPVDERQAKVDSFLQTAPSFPFTEDRLAHFIYTGTGSNPAVPGDFNGWDPANAPMINISGTNFWYRTEEFENFARLDYKLYYNNGTWILDPRNPYKAPGGFGDNSELRMPEYIPPPEIEFYAEIPHGRFQDTLFYSTNLNNSRQIRVYLPPGYDQTTVEYPMVLMHDGLEYISFAKMNNVVDYLLSKELIEPVITVFVPPVDRSPEYIDSKQDAFTKFIVDELIPWIDQKYRTIDDPAYRAVMGSSSGGNISLWLGMNHPDIFGKVGAFSSYVENDIQTFFENSPGLDLKIYMNHGTYDYLTAIQQSVSAFVPVLQAKEYEFQFSEYPEGHSWGFWRAHLDDALIYFFPASTTAIKADPLIPGGFRLYQNYPNPFNPETHIRYVIEKQENITLNIYNVLGEHVRLLVNGSRGVGEHVIIWNGLNEKGLQASSGIYFYRLTIGTMEIRTRRMILMR